MSKCKGCGKQLKKDQLFCTECGKPINDDVQQVDEEIEEQQDNHEFETVQVKDETEEIAKMLQALHEEEILVPEEVQEEQQNIERAVVKPETEPATIPVVTSAQGVTTPAIVATSTMQAQPANSNKIVSVFGYIINLILLAIPVVGLIMAIVWVLGGSKNQNRINLAKAYLVLVIFALVIFVAGSITFAVSGDTVSTVVYKGVDEWSGGFFSKNNIKTFDDFVEIYYKLDHFNEYEAYLKESNKSQQSTTVPQTTQQQDATASPNENTTQPLQTTQPTSWYAPAA